MIAPKPESRCKCGYKLQKYWAYCPQCKREQTWKDTAKETNADCFYCGWVVSDLFSYCPWCAADIYEEGYSKVNPCKSAKGFNRLTIKCDGGCGGYVQYPMSYCPWCGVFQEWAEDNYEGECYYCHRGVNDWMEVCPWCGEDHTGQDRIGVVLNTVTRLLKSCKIMNWSYRVLLRPGDSGVDPKYPKIVEIDRKYLRKQIKRPDKFQLPWSMLSGLLLHELGHSFLFHHWSWTRTKRFKRVFGEVHKAYRGVDNSWVDFHKRRVTTTKVDFVSSYAATHPQEDFAETFRYYVTRSGRMRELLAEFGRKRKGVIVYEKFLALHDFISSIRR